MKHFIIFLVVLAFVAGCDDEESRVIDTGSAYFPLKKGFYHVYSVNEVRYTSLSEPEVQAYEIMMEVADSFPSPQSEITYVIHRSRRSSETEPWIALDTWSARKDNSKAIVSEENTPFVKVIFPVRSGSRWNGNAFNTLGEDLYEIKDIDQPFAVNGMTFEKALTIEQERNEDLIVFNDQRKEVYALGVGLVYKELRQLNYCTDDNCIGQQQIESGIEMNLVIKQYGTH